MKRTKEEIETLRATTPHATTRRGKGRPRSSEPTTAITGRMPVAVVDAMRAMLRRERLSVGQYLTKLVERDLGTNNLNE